MDFTVCFHESKNSFTSRLQARPLLGWSLQSFQGTAKVTVSTCSYSHSTRCSYTHGKPSRAAAQGTQALSSEEGTLNKAPYEEQDAWQTFTRAHAFEQRSLRNTNFTARIC